MSKFKRGTKKGVGAINTASLPDIVFMLLFFFMVTTVMKETTLKVNITLPGATQIKKLEKKSLVSFIYIGEPTRAYQSLYGTTPRIQLNDAFAKVDDIRDFISSERDAMDENDKALMTVSLKVDQNTKMGIVTDVKQALRKSNALKINYSTRKDDSFLK
ncbi:MAG TPA: biopolymer transporter ExbD [Bacteroidales bacterium]|nr:biopolymer transporter ExbD [Bacteroidales bacterium]